MHKYIEYISDLLFLHDCVIIPEFGGFICNHKSASINEKTGVICPPGKDIVFNKNLKHNDGLLANWIATQEDIPYEKAVKQLIFFAEDLKVRLNQGQHIDFKGIGTFYTDRKFNIIFINSRQNFFAETFGMTPIALKAGATSSKRYLSTSDNNSMQASSTLIKLKSPHHLVQKLFKLGLAGAAVAGVVTISQVSIYQNDRHEHWKKIENTTSIRPEFHALQKDIDGPTFNHIISPEYDYLDYDPLNDLLK